MLEHPEEAASMAAAARSALGDRFRPQALGEDLMQVYPIAMRIGAGRVAAAMQRQSRAR
jgi:hypothetical protein